MSRARLETPASDQFAVPATAVGLCRLRRPGRTNSGGTTTIGARCAGHPRRNPRGLFSIRTARTRTSVSRAAAKPSRAFSRSRASPSATRCTRSSACALDRWENSDGHLRNVAVASGNLLLQDFYPTRTGTEFSPSAGVTWQATKELEFHVAGQRAFREPTLNELYRPFRQGNTTTLANAGLATEHADTGEIGATWKRERARRDPGGHSPPASTDAVSNVTLAAGPGTFPLFGTLPAGSHRPGAPEPRPRRHRRASSSALDWRPSDALRVNLSSIDEEATVERGRQWRRALSGMTLPEVPR